ncbi:MAG: A24 family peptidase C-terminal domain-containing protein [Candidatus Bathyarchaeia archaeon]
MQQVLAAARVALTLAVLVYASWSDYKTREVTNRVWMVYAPAALALSLVELLLYDQPRLPLFALSFGFTAGFALLLFYTGGFGGADAKAFMCLALALPFFPETLLKPLVTGGLSPLSQTIFPITILSNSVLIAAASGLYLLIRNIARRTSTGKPFFEGTLAKESVGKRILVMLTGKKYPLATLKTKWHVYPMEDITEPMADAEPKRKLIVVPRDEGRSEIVDRLSKAAEAGKIDHEVWATPGLPMLIFVTVGFVLALTLGDIIWILISHMLG